MSPIDPDDALAGPTPELIRSRFPLQASRGVPEIRLHKAAPESGIWRLAKADPAFGNPYWAYDWGGGLALARHLLDHPQAVAGRRVLDAGTGSGVVAIAAAMAGAREVIAADVDRYALAATRLNAAANGVAVRTLLGDLTEGPAPDVDVVLVGDLFYDADLATRVTAFLDRCLDAGAEVLVGDPWRATLPRDRLRLLAEYPGGDFAESAPDHSRTNAVFAFMAGDDGA